MFEICFNYVASRGQIRDCKGTRLDLCMPQVGQDIDKWSTLIKIVTVFDSQKSANYILNLFS